MQDSVNKPIRVTLDLIAKENEQYFMELLDHCLENKHLSEGNIRYLEQFGFIDIYGHIRTEIKNNIIKVVDML
jgi:hypothetical protein